MWMLTENGRLSNLAQLHAIKVDALSDGKFRLTGVAPTEHITISMHDTQKAATDALLELRTRLNGSRRS